MKKRDILSSWMVTLVLVVGSGHAEPFSQEKGSKRFAVIPALPKVLPQEAPVWQPKNLEIEQPIVDPNQIKREWIQGIYNWLSHQQNSLTGLVESFEDSKDPFLHNQAATYDQALAGMAFLILGDLERAKKILDFYQEKWKGKGFYNFYSTQNGRVGLEWRRHVGPNMWLALLVYQYTEATGDKTYLSLGEGLCDWVLSIPHYNGGVAMSDLDEADIPWREIVSTENVIDVIAVFEMAVKMTTDYRKQQWYKEELQQAKVFLRDFVIKSDGSIARGYRPFIDGVDSVPALDTTTWLIGTALPENIYPDYGVPVTRMIKKAEKTFGIDLPEGRGYDYTSSEEAAKANRERICSLEWSGEMAQVYWLMMAQADSLSQPKEEYENKLKEVLKGIDFYMQREEGRISYPYASASFEKTFSDGWHTPRAKQTGVAAGSVASTCWRLFADLWNPLRLGSFPKQAYLQIKKVPYEKVALEKIEQAQNLPSALTSEGLTTAAWLNLKDGNKEQAKKFALKCIHLYSQQASEEQAIKASHGGLIRSKVPNEKTKQRIFRYSVLNDVAACWMILSKVDPLLKKQAAQMIHSKYSLAQVWDPKGFFWTVADALPLN